MQNTDRMREAGLVYYDPPSWISRQISLRAALAVIEHNQPFAQTRNIWDPTTAEQQWLDSARGVMVQLAELPDTAPVPSALLHAIDGVGIGLRNTGGSRVGSSLAVAMCALERRGPDQAWLPAQLCHDIVLPFRVADATGGVYLSMQTPRVRKDVMDAFEAIWIAREFEAAYAYVDGVVTSGEWKIGSSPSSPSRRSRRR